MRIEAYIGGRWRHCADLTGESGSRQRAVRLTYAADYAVEHLFASDLHALSARLPVDLGERQYAIWPSFLIDLLPQGAARRRLERVAGGELTEWDLLQRGAFNPVGNLRVIPDQTAPTLTHQPFALEQMTRRADEFLEYAAGTGAAVVGATDTQGEAPKFWVVQDSLGNWYPDDGRCDEFAAKHALLKFPVPESGHYSQIILRNEAAYQRVARQLGLRTTDEAPQFIDGALLVPRFDRRGSPGHVERLGVESLYSVAGVSEAGQSLRHDQALIELAQVLTDFEGELREYVWRDLFNLALGNRDNHGRNTAILKDTDGSIRLSPIFDVGPSFLDARAIVRVIRWDGEEPGRLDWRTVIDRIEIRAREADVKIDAQLLACAFGDFGEAMHKLPQLLSKNGVDDFIIEQRREDIDRLAKSLADLPSTRRSAHA
jgi:serine/threonine-protein kinase HipA